VETLVLNLFFFVLQNNNLLLQGGRCTIKGSIHSDMPDVPALFLCMVLYPQPGACRFRKENE